MFGMEAALDTGWIRDIQEAFALFPEEVDRWVRRDIVPYARHYVDKTLRVAPPRRQWPGDYPLEWTSEKQRKAYWATNGFGAGIPYRRTNTLIHDWHVIADYQAGFTGVQVYNLNDAAQYVYGDDQALHKQWFHTVTGWPTALEHLQALSLELGDRIEDGWPHVLDEMLMEAQRHG
ncbi:MAG: hypothetical protein WCZ87_00315 [Thiohalobacteraceae bacterium]